MVVILSFIVGFLADCDGKSVGNKEESALRLRILCQGGHFAG